MKIFSLGGITDLKRPGRRRSDATLLEQDALEQDAVHYGRDDGTNERFQNHPEK